MQRRGLSSFSLLRSDGVGTHDAQTREKTFGWLTEKRPQKAWLSPPVVTHQNNSTGNHEHVWKQTSEGKREYPSAMIRMLVNGFVHDLRPPQLHMFV